MSHNLFNENNENKILWVWFLICNRILIMKTIQNNPSIDKQKNEALKAWKSYKQINMHVIADL